MEITFTGPISASAESTVTSASSSASSLTDDDKALLGDENSTEENVHQPGTGTSGLKKQGSDYCPYKIVKHPAPHTARAKEILKNHPSIKPLLGSKNPMSAVYIVGLVLIQVAFASYFDWRHNYNVPGPVGLTTELLLVSYTFGAVVTHGLWVLVHECCHHLVFKTRWLNRVFNLICNIPMVIPMSVGFCVFHMPHHTHLGDLERDADIALPIEAWFLGGGALRRLMWQALYPLILGLRSQLNRYASQLWKQSAWTPWALPQFLVQTAFVTSWYHGHQQSWHGLRYMLLSCYFSIGPHPLGVRWIQEHYVVEEGQETYSYYGPLNKVAFNIGYHNEHHDFPTVPYNELPKLTNAAPEAYDTLRSHSSWIRLWWEFLTNTEWEVFRMAREFKHGAGHSKSE
eukprot:CAMPEP_0172529366 /NCGR_PEP_ID=MMETSP1067-20121228/3465_1 /TAXON_ID=265564 ORGANISM="Thalassiosira punctigera, Strain Tpunct2005C2" /NCGR_SAMPLE_ID=MMETSP1067 /ASSEMBLY_ACC=CAM_ASM_000444 /LENGTH=399 /DNA_ID=CAMNT_0013313407 /DNA_START=143 /DNA_END=1342 /DNA_ORIENTATION=-